MGKVLNNRFSFFRGIFGDNTLNTDSRTTAAKNMILDALTSEENPYEDQWPVFNMLWGRHSQDQSYSQVFGELTMLIEFHKLLTGWQSETDKKISDTTENSGLKNKIYSKLEWIENPYPESKGFTILWANHWKDEDYKEILRAFALLHELYSAIKKSLKE